VRGASEDWYPYPFVDVARHGYERVLVNAVIFFVCFLGGALAFVPSGTGGSRLRGAEMHSSVTADA
jgi:hypothetical protein